MKRKTLDLSLDTCFIRNMFTSNITVVFKNNKIISVSDFKNDINFYLRKFGLYPTNMLVYDSNYIYFIYINSYIDYVFRYYIGDSSEEFLCLSSNSEDKLYKYDLNNNTLKL